MMNLDDYPDNKEVDGYVSVIRKIADLRNIKDEDRINELIVQASSFIGYDPKVAPLIKKRLWTIMGHRLDLGTMIVSEHKAWYMARTKEMDMECTERNLKYLQQDGGLSTDIVSKLDEVTNEIMDGLGDPRADGFKRKGLVMGDVQSGKTNTYTMLACKAADVGYRVIILLTGTLEILRRQTQARLDKGLVGKDSAFMLKPNTTDRYIGVGEINSSVKFASFTSTVNDFRGSVATQLNLDIEDLDVPVLLVLKKNKNILNNLYDWLTTNTIGSIKSPLLLIDDEADNASINTSASNITAINSSIRNILNLFEKSTYVGFTATPYANIFIDPEEYNDLYPRDFIYCLRSPSNYISPKSMYQDGGKHQYMLQTIDMENKDEGIKEIKYKHTKDFKVTKIPDSLKEAINTFLLSCTIRDLRGEKRSHMSMMVNASRYTDVQESIKELISKYMFDIKSVLETYCKLPESEALKQPLIAGLKITWSELYSHIGYPWITIQNNLASSVNPIVVRSINQRNGPKNLNYSECPDGLRVIAIGGNSLSRGLTLEGLCVSYFYRRSQNYDTLMQMGRWFGYRDDYSDLCRVWMTRESMDWYEEISTSTEELKREFILMYNLGKTPNDFGFRVRNDVSGLIITARNKMRNAGETYIYKSLNGSAVWTSSISVKKEEVIRNDELVIDTVSSLMDYSKPYFNENTKNYIWTNVPGTYVINFLKKYIYPKERNYIFDNEALIETIKKIQDKNWDLAIQHGSGMQYKELYEKFGLNINIPVRTKFTPNTDSIRFNSAGLMSADNMREGLYVPSNAGIYREGPIQTLKENEKLKNTLWGKYDEILKAEKKYEKNKDVNYPAKTYLNTDERNPIMLLYPIDLVYKEPAENKNPEEENNKRRIISSLSDDEKLIPIGVALGFPSLDVDPDNPASDKLAIRYRTTPIYEKMHGNEDLDMEDEI